MSSDGPLIGSSCAVFVTIDNDMNHHRTVYLLSESVGWGNRIDVVNELRCDRLGFASASPWASRKMFASSPPENFLARRGRRPKANRFHDPFLRSPCRAQERTFGIPQNVSG